jgi:hypothetical protein
MVTVVSLLQIVDYVGLLDSSCDLQPIHTKSFVNRLHLVLQISKISLKILRLRIFCVYGWKLNRAQMVELVTNKQKPRTKWEQSLLFTGFRKSKFCTAPMHSLPRLCSLG